jgi:hypothetical protein
MNVTRNCLCLLIALVSLSLAALSADSPNIQQIEIKSRWGGLGVAPTTELVIRNEKGRYRLGSKQIDSALVEALSSALNEPQLAKPDIGNLGVTKAWLEEKVTSIPDKSSWWKLKEGTAKQKALFRNSFIDPAFIGTILPSLFNFSRTDDYPDVEVTVSRGDGSTVTASSHSQYLFMLPWRVSSNGNTFSTFNSNVSRAVAALMPRKSTNKERISGDGFDVELAEATMKNIERDWNLLGVEDKAANALAILRTEYTVRSADINPYHDVGFGEKWNKGKTTEENLHATLTKDTFPRNFYDDVILLYKDGEVSGADEFIRNASAYEELALSVPWLDRLRQTYPQLGMTLLWVHDRSFSDKALRIFEADMRALNKESLAKEIRMLQHQVAVLTVNYGDYWLILPDRRMVLWRYESVSGLLGWKRSDFTARECTDYAGVTGGCVGAVVNPDGNIGAPGD